MSISIRVKEDKVSSVDFPKLMIDRKDKMIVLFYRHEEGTILDTGNNNGSYHFLGNYEEDWDMSDFEDYNKEICIKNVD